jgi:hypothetical protein
MNGQCLRSLIVIPLLLLFFSCALFQSPEGEDARLPEWLRKGQGPKTVVIMPFENLTDEPELEVLLRRSFYSHFSPKNYRDIELAEVDRALETLRSASSKTWKDLSPTDLGEFFHADFIIYGKVMEFQKVFAGIYSQIALKVEVEMVECSTGKGIWWKTIMKRSHEGGLPFSLFGVIPEAVRSGWHMKRERTLDLVDRINREFAELIPDPPGPLVSTFFVDIQVGSFLEKGLALKIQQELQDKGLSPRVETVTIGDRTWHRVLLGPYREMAEAEKVRAAVSENPNFKPIYIYHHLTPKEKGG